MHKQIEQLAEMIRVLILKMLKDANGGNSELAIGEADSFMQLHFGTDSEQLRNMNDKELLDYCSNENPGRLELAADVLTEIAKLEKDQKTSIRTSETAINILKHINQREKTFSLERENKIKELSHLITIK